MATKKKRSSVATKTGDKVKLDYIAALSEDYLTYYRSIKWQLTSGQTLYRNLDNLDLTDFYYMRDDYQISACLNTITFTVQQVDWRIDCKDKAIKEFCENNMKQIWTRLIRGISQAFWAGYSPMVKVYDYDERQNKIYIDKMIDLDPDGCEVKLEAGKFVGFYQGDKLIEPPYAFWYTFMMANNDYTGQKLLRAAYLPWYFSQIVHLFANRYYERFGDPVVLGYAPTDLVEDLSEGDTSGSVKTGMGVMRKIVRKIRNQSSVTLPSDRDENGNLLWEIKYLESQMRGADYERYLSRLDIEKSRAIFVPVPELIFSSGRERPGSFNLGIEQKNTFMMLLNAILEDLKDHIERYILEDLVKFNFGENAPKAFFIVENMGKISESSLVKVLVEQIKSGTAQPEIDDIARRLGIRIEGAEEVTSDEEKVPPKKEESSQEKEALGYFQKKKDEGEAVAIIREPNKREVRTDWQKIVLALDTSEERLLQEIRDIYEEANRRLKVQLETIFQQGLNGEAKRKAFSKIKLPFKAKIKDKWYEVARAVYLVGMEEINKSDKLGIKEKISADDETLLREKAGAISEYQINLLENKIRFLLQQAYENNLTLFSVLLLLSSIFIDFTAKGKTVDKGISYLSIWALQLGRWAAVSLSGREIIAKQFSAIIDERTCKLCLFLDQKVVTIENPDFYAMSVPFHFSCRCVEIPVYVGEKIIASEKYKRPDKDLLEEFGGLVPQIFRKAGYGKSKAKKI